MKSACGSTSQKTRLRDDIPYSVSHSKAVLGAVSRRPLRIVARAIIEGFLCAEIHSSAPGIKIGTADGFALRQAFPEEYSEAADECVARAGTVDAFHSK